MNKIKCVSFNLYKYHNFLNKCVKILSNLYNKGSVTTTRKNKSITKGFVYEIKLSFLKRVIVITSF